MKKIYGSYLACQKARRDAFRKNGRCPACGGVRDRLPLLTCVACGQAVQRSVARRQEPYEHVVVRVQKPLPAVLKVHPRIPVPLKGTIAMNLVRGTHRRAA